MVPARSASVAERAKDPTLPVHGAELRNAFGRHDCPYATSGAFPPLNDDIFGAAESNAVSISKPGQPIELNSLVSKEALRKYTEALKGDMYISIMDIGPAGTGAKPHQVPVSQIRFCRHDAKRCHLSESSGNIIAVNADNLDNIYIEAGDIHSIVRDFAPMQFPHIGFVSGGSIFCASEFGNIVNDTSKRQRNSIKIDTSPLMQEVADIYVKASQASDEDFDGAVEKCNAISEKADALGIALGVSAAGGAVSTIAGGVEIAGRAARSEKITGGGAGLALDIGATAGGLASGISGAVGLFKLLPELKSAVKDCQDAVSKLR